MILPNIEKKKKGTYKKERGEAVRPATIRQRDTSCNLIVRNKMPKFRQSRGNIQTGEYFGSD